MTDAFSFQLESTKSFDEVVANIEQQTVAHKFRVLAIHDVQQTLREKGLARGPLKIIEVCNGVFAHQALQKDSHAALFMPCRFSVHVEGGKTVVRLGRPSMIAEVLPGAGLDELARDVENTLKKVMAASV
jgi:uncharacterized protein (DUF302 family)